MVQKTGTIMFQAAALLVWQTFPSTHVVLGSKIHTLSGFSAFKKPYYVGTWTLRGVAIP